MGCSKCDYTGWGKEYEPETGFVDVPCPYCHGIDGEEPDIVTETNDAAIQAEIDEAWLQYAGKQQYTLDNQSHLW